MEKLKKQIEALLNRFRTEERRRAVAQHKWQVNHEKAVREHHKQKEAEHAAIKAAKEHHPKLAEAENAKAARCRHRAAKAHARATYFVGKVKEFSQGVLDLESRIELKKAKLKKLEERGVHFVSKNRVAGGSAKDRLAFCMHYSELHGSQFYSQTGSLDLKHGLTGPSAGHRHDCSSWADSMFFSADLKDMVGDDFLENVWTGNEAEHGEPIAEAQLDTGCAIFYGTAPFHHVELKDGPMSESDHTVGHGSPPIDRGVVALLPGPRAYRRYIK